MEGNDTNNIIMPKIYKLEQTQIKAGKGGYRKGFWGGMIALPPTKQWGLNGNSGGGSYASYPYYGHLNHPFTPTFDYNYGVPKQVYWTVPVNGYTANNLFNVYHKPFLQQLTNKNSKVLKRHYYLRATDIEQLSFRKKIFDDGQEYIINKISNYSASDEKSTEVELIKLIDYTPYVAAEEENNTGGGGNQNRFAGAMSEFFESSFQNGQFRVPNKLRTNETTITANHVVNTDKFDLYKIDASAGRVNISLMNQNMPIRFIKTDASAFRVHIYPNTGEILGVGVVDGYMLNARGSFVEITPSGNDFIITGSRL
jgi:hypothetical protein